MELPSLKLDQTNELVFELSIQGTKSEPIFRFVCETNDMAFSFDGKRGSDGEVMFSLPPLEEKLSPGSYDGHLEVIIENKLFVPMEMPLVFESGARVVTESVRVVQKDKAPIENESGIQVVGIKTSGSKVSVAKKKDSSMGKTLREVYEARKANKNKKPSGFKDRLRKAEKR